MSTKISFYPLGSLETPDLDLHSKIHIMPVDALYFNRPSLNLFVDAVFNNFIDLISVDFMKHTKMEIYKLLKSPNMKGFIIYIGKKIAGYLLGESLIVADGRRVFYIDYFYITPSLREPPSSKGRSFSARILDKTIEMARVLRFDAVVTIIDTQDKLTYDFYRRRDFMIDVTLRRNDRYEVLSILLY